MKQVVVSALLILLSGDASNAFTARSQSSIMQRPLTLTPTPFGFGINSGDLAARTPTQLAAGPIDVIDPSYNLALGSLGLGLLFGVPGSPLKSKLGAFLGGIPLTLFGLFLAFQTTTLRFTFDDDNFSLVKSSGESLGENVVVGGENVWAYNKFVNYDLL